MNHSEIVSFIMGTANLIRDSFRRSKYQDVILPLTVLRRIDQVLEPTKAKVLETHREFKDRLDNPDDLLRQASGYAFYNTSRFTFERLVDDPPDLAANLRTYISSFSSNMREVIEKFDFDNTISKLDDAGLLFQVMERFAQVDLHPDRVSNPMMGTIFEELIRKFNEALNENPGEHFTPRDVVELMVHLLIEGDEEKLAKDHAIFTVHDPCCGTGGMLTITKDVIQGSPKREGINPTAYVHLFGQEVNPETFAICKADLYIKSPDGKDAENILFGSTLSNDRHSGHHFDYLIANPPYGKDWKRDRTEVDEEADRGSSGRFEAGTPRISDGQLLFLQHMLHHMKEPGEDGSRIAIIMNGSPLFTGDAGSGESEIRRWILENDWLEALVALPEQLFYNTGIATYVWVLSNRKPAERRGKVQLIDATELWVPMKKSLGDKRREISDADREAILGLFRGMEEDGKQSKVLPNETFGFRKVRVEQPLRLNFEASEERIARLEDERAFQNLAKSRKRDPEKKREEVEEGRALQERVREMLSTMPSQRFTDRKAFRKALKAAMKQADLSLKKSIRTAIESALSEQDEEAAICRDRKGSPEYDTDLRDYENVPLDEEVTEYFEREVQPYVPEAWIDGSYTDDKDGRVGRVGYEINFNRYFYEYQPPRPLEEIEADIRKIEKEIVGMLGEVGLVRTNRTAVIAQAVTKGLDPDVAMKDSGVEWIGEIPKHWEVSKVRHVARLESGHTPSRRVPEYWVDCDVPWVTLADVGPLRSGLVDYVESTKEKVSELGLANSAARKLPPGTVVLSRTASVGFAAIITKEMATTQDFANWVCGDLILPEFLLNVFRAMQPEFRRLRMGSTHQTVYMPDIRGLRTPLPPLEEQREIVERLRSGVQRLRELLRMTDEVSSLLQEYRTALISAAVTGKIDVRDKVPA